MFKNTEKNVYFFKDNIKHGMPADPAEFSDLIS